MPFREHGPKEVEYVAPPLIPSDKEMFLDQNARDIREIQAQQEIRNTPINLHERLQKAKRNRQQGPVQTERPYRPAKTGRYWEPEKTIIDEFDPTPPWPEVDPIYKFPK